MTSFPNRLIFFLGLFLYLMPLKAQLPSDTLRLQVERFLDQWHRDAAVGNHEAYIGAMSPQGVYIGTDATERWSATEFSIWSKPYFDRKHTWSFTALNRHIDFSSDGFTAWFDELLDTQMGICRGSGVLQIRDGVWKIEQYVLSASIPNDIMRKVTAQKKGIDSLLIPYLQNNIRDAGKAMTLKSVFDKHGMHGTILILDAATGENTGYNPARWDSGYLPASTFKIPNSLIGLETGAIDTTYIFAWNGKKQKLPQWEKNLNLQEAFRVSCVPCYQELARKIGTARMSEWLGRFDYGNIVVTPATIDLFWLEGPSRITPRQQVRFIQKLYREQLPLKPATMKAVKRLMVNETTDAYTLSGKTGWAIRNGNNYGWFVGYLETGGKVYFFATLVEPKNQEQTTDFAAARKAITLEVFRMLERIP